MARTRGLLTENDRKVLTGKADVTENREHQVVWEVRKRIQEEVPKDIAVLAEHRPDVLSELQDIVCEGDDD